MRAEGAASALVIVTVDDLRVMIREEVRAALAPAAEPESLYARVADYARRVRVSERTAWNWVRQGVPTIGQGRTRRVDVHAADHWLRARGGEQLDDAVERRARTDARQATRRRAPPDDGLR